MFDISSNSLNKSSRSVDELQPAYTDRFVDVLSSVHIPVSDNLQDRFDVVTSNLSLKIYTFQLKCIFRLHFDIPVLYLTRIIY